MKTLHNENSLTLSPPLLNSCVVVQYDEWKWKRRRSEVGVTWCCRVGGEGAVITYTHFTLVGCFNHTINENRMTNSFTLREAKQVERNDWNYSLNKLSRLLTYSDPVVYISCWSGVETRDLYNWPVMNSQ